MFVSVSLVSSKTTYIMQHEGCPHIQNGQELGTAQAIEAFHVGVVLVAVLSTVPYESLTPSTYVFSKEHILVLPVLRGVNAIGGTFL
jgi:hypothetical protein